MESECFLPNSSTYVSHFDDILSNCSFVYHASEISSSVKGAEDGGMYSFIERRKRAWNPDLSFFFFRSFLLGSSDERLLLLLDCLFDFFLSFEEEEEEEVFFAAVDISVLSVTFRCFFMLVFSFSLLLLLLLLLLLPFEDESDDAFVVASVRDVEEDSDNNSVSSESKSKILRPCEIMPSASLLVYFLFILDEARLKLS